MNRDQLTEFLSEYLRISDFNDICPNGLQVEGCSDIKKIITGVSASVELFKHAARENADTIIVHHGIIWSFERPIYKGGYRERLRILLERNINLYGIHLPLDAHEEVGNNTQIARRLNLKKIIPFGTHKGQYIGVWGEIELIDKDIFFKTISEVVDREPLIFDYGPDKIKSVGIISGGAQKDVIQAVNAGLDLYLTGEVSEHIMHYAKEEKIHFVSAGHYATEKFGIIALGNELLKRFDVQVSFIDIPNPV
jgi:dinuclear metal center YbgI/SA1388 family protein